MFTLSCHLIQPSSKKKPLVQADMYSLSHLIYLPSQALSWDMLSCGLQPTIHTDLALSKAFQYFLPMDPPFPPRLDPLAENHEKMDGVFS